MPFILGISAAFSWIMRSALGAALKELLLLAFFFLEPFVAKALVILGFTSITIKGLEFATDALISHLDGLTSSLPHTVISIMGIMQLDVGISMIVSATLIKLSIAGLNKLGDMKKTTFNPYRDM